MKTLILLLLVASGSAFAQCKGVQSKTDEFTGAVSRQTKWERLAPGVQALILHHNSVVGIMFYADLGCVSPNDSKAYFKFSDGSVIELQHAGEISCNDGVALVVAINDHVEAFTTKSIEKIRLVGNRTIDFQLLKPTYIGDTLNQCFDLSGL